jgi:aldose 1-epimerase
MAEAREIDGVPVMVLSSPATGLEAAFAPGACMVGCSLRIGGQEFLGVRGGLAKYAQTGSTMGIPLLYPWANRLDREIDSPLVRRDPNGLPIHGLLGGSRAWELTHTGGERLSARLDFGANPELLALFPYPHVVEVDATLDGDALTVVTRVIPSGDEAVPIAFGWHPYLSLADVPRASWLVTLPVRSRLVLDQRLLPTGAVEPVEYAPREPLGERTFDDGYRDVGDGARFELEGGGRRLTVELVSGYPFAQVYAPPGEDLIAFEPMTAPTNALVSGDGLRRVEPGGSFEAAFRIGVETVP